MGGKKEGAKNISSISRYLLMFALISIFLLQIISAIDYNAPNDVFYNFTFDYAKFQVRSCANPDCSDGSFIGPDNSSSSWFIFPDANWRNNIILTNLASNRYFQYISTLFYGDDFVQTPRLFNVTIKYTPDVISSSWGSISYAIGETLNCSTIFYGGSGYNVTFRFYNGSNAYSERNLSASNGISVSAIVPADVTNAYENWTCQARVYNETFASDWESSDVRTITNIPFYGTPNSVFYNFLDSDYNASDFNSGLLKMQVRKCSLRDCSDAPSFVGYDNTSSTWFTNSTGNLSILGTGRYLQYQVYMNTSNVSYSPQYWNLSVERTLLDTTSPLVTFQGPSNNTYYNISSFTFNATWVSDYPNDLAQCYLYLNSILNQSNLSISNNSVASFNLNLSDGTYTWNMNCSDGSLLWNNTVVNSFYVDTHSPNGTLISPANNTYSGNVSQNFTANITDTNLANATLNVVQQGNYWLNFDGVDDNIAIASSNSLNSTGGFALSLWVYAKGYGDYAVPISKGYQDWSTPYYGITYLGSGGTFQFAYHNKTDNTGYLYCAGPSTLGNWHNIIMIHNETDTQSYLDGTYCSGSNTLTVGGSIQANAYPITIGSNMIGHSWTYWNGSIDEVRIYNRSLLSSEILQLYRNKLKSSPELLNDSLVAYYNFNQGSGTTLTDISGNGNPGTITGATWANSYTSTTNFAEGTISTVIGVVDNLIDGVYNWWWSIWDRAGNQFTTENRTLTIDMIPPSLSFITPTLSNGSGIAGDMIINASITEINLANVSYTWNGVTQIFNTNNSSLTNLGNGSWLFTYTQNVPAGNILYPYNVSAMDLAGNTNSTETRLVRGDIPPSFGSIITSPNLTDYDNLDPNVNVSITANISDLTGNFQSAIIEWKNSTSDYVHNVSMDYVSGNGYSSIMNGTLTLPNYESNITFRIWANNTAGETNISSSYLLQSFWDCTWTATGDLGATAGWNNNKKIGDLIINNTGDAEYANNNCTLQFRISYNLPEGRIYYDGEYLKSAVLYTINAKGISNITINATFLNEVNSEGVTITSTEARGRSNTNNRTTTATLVSNQQGPYLYNAITSYPNEVPLTPGNFSLMGYIRNLMGSVDVNENNTAYNVTLYWDLPSGITNVSGQLNMSYVNITDNNYNYANSNFSFSSLSSMIPGSKAVTLYAYGYNLSGDRIKDVSGNMLLSYGINISFTCNNVSDGVYVTACGAADGDYVAPVVTTPGTGSGGGGGGGGSASGFSKSSRADYQFVRGKTNEIKVPFKNNDLNITLKNLKFSLAGVLAKYMEVVPASLDSLLPQQTINISIKITSPGFIETGQQTINLDITGDSSGQNYNEEKTIVLQVNDISKDDAQTLISNATKLTEEFGSAGFNDSYVTNLVISMNKAFDALDYSNVQENYNLLSSLIQNALDAKKTINEMNGLIAQAKEKGIDVSGSERIIGLAQLSLERNDFSEAAQRAKEAQTTFALEVKGEIASLSYYLKNNKQEIGMSAVFLFVLSFAGYKGARIRVIIRKIKKLKDEEKILQQLMKVVQRQTFTEKKMSMEEYQQSMQYYEKRLSDVIEQLIELESQRAHILKFVGEAKRLKAERMRIIELIKEIQKQYLKEKIIETKSYELRLESYNRRLGQIDENLATLEAKAALKGVLK